MSNVTCMFKQIGTSSHAMRSGVHLLTRPFA